MSAYGDLPDPFSTAAKQNGKSGLEAKLAKVNGQ